LHRKISRVLADILADVFVPQFINKINSFFYFLILLADILADLAEPNNKKGTILVPYLSMIPCGPL